MTAGTRVGLYTGGGPRAFLLPMAIYAATAVYLGLNWDRIPERFPIHWRAGGEPDRWAARSLSGVYGVVLIGVALSLVLMAVSRASLRRAAAGSAEANLRAGAVKLMIAVCYLVAGLTCWLAVRPLWFPGGRLGSEFRVILAAVAVVTGVYLYLLIRLSRVAPDDHWKWGVLYYNPEDPALWVEKRLGFGWTLNFANRWSWLILVGTFAVLTVVLLLVR